MTPEEKARKKIDRLLEAAGWVIQDRNEMNLGASLGVAVREFPLSEGPADYTLFINRKAVGVLEAKPEGTTLSGVAEQTKKYLTGIPRNVPAVQQPLPFGYESTGVETFFLDCREINPRSRQVFTFHTPETLQEWLQENPLRNCLFDLPALQKQGLRDCQIEAIENLEQSLKDNRPRALVQMATGSGKTFMAVNLCYRLIKFAGAKRILFLVDRNNLGRQTKREFQQYVTPDDGRKFTELYNVQHLTSNTIDNVSKVCITTIQRLFSMLKGEDLPDEELEEHSMFDIAPPDQKPKEVAYNPAIPIDTFDFIITDECHRSIYNLWRQVLEYFDAFLIGLTATPSKQTLGFFNQNLVTEYSHERAVADGVNVGYDVYRIQTRITSSGDKVDAGFYVDKRDKLTRKRRWELLDEDLEYDASQLDRSVVSESQIRTVIKTFKEKLFVDMFPGRTEVPKTLIFAKDDSHAEDIVHIVREEFGKGNDFCKKITYRTTGEKPEDLIASFRNSYHPRITVTVDMISTGTDIRPLECLIFMRDVKSRVYFEQMKGRGTRTVSDTDLKTVTPDALSKSHFVIVDAVGVCESDKTDSRPLERKRNVSFEKLITNIALGNHDEDSLTSLAGRLARLDRELPQKDKKELEKIAGQPLKMLINDLLDAVDPDQQTEKAKKLFNTEKPSVDQMKKAVEELAKKACTPFDSPHLRNTLIEFKKRNEQTIDTVSKDEVLLAGYDVRAKEKAEEIVRTFKKFIDDNEDELTAWQIIYSKPYAKRHVTYEEIKQLAEDIKRPPYNLNQDLVWSAFEKLDKSKVKGAGPHKLLTNIISLIRFAVGQDAVLEEFHALVEYRFEHWLQDQEKQGIKFTSEQREWLTMIKAHIATSLSITKDDLQNVPFNQKGGLIKAHKVFGDKLERFLEELNEVLVT